MTFTAFDVLGVVVIVLMIVEIFMNNWYLYPLTLAGVAVQVANYTSHGDLTYAWWIFIGMLQLYSFALNYARWLRNR